MSHPADTHKLLEILGNKLRPVVTDDPGIHSRKLLSCPLDDDLDICLLHALSDLPVHNRSTVSVQHSTQVVEGPTNIYIANIYVPVLMRLGRMLEAFSLLGGFPVPPVEISSSLKNPVDGARTHRYNISIQHHERQPAVALGGVVKIEITNRFLLPILQPEISGIQLLCSLIIPYRLFHS